MLGCSLVDVPCVTLEQIKKSKSRHQYENRSRGSRFPRTVDPSSEYGVSTSTLINAIVGPDEDREDLEDFIEEVEGDGVIGDGVMGLPSFS